MSLLQLTGGRADRPVATTPEVASMLVAGAVVAIGVSGGKDSSACALATIRHLDAIGHAGPRVLIHADLGRVEWSESMRVCERLATRTGLALIVVRREAGDMMDRWATRWRNNVKRYVELSCVKVIPPWSTPSMRFCTSELKTAVMCRELVKRYPGQTILSACGIRREESRKRKSAKVVKPQPKLTSTPRDKARHTVGFDWNPIADWSIADVVAIHRTESFVLHEAYTRFNMTRVSCVYCIMSSADDLANATTCAENHDVYRLQVDLEIESTFSFQADRWLGDVAPHLLTDHQRMGLVAAKARAAQREAIEAPIPKHLLYVKGWPTVMPTYEEAVMLADIRREMGALLGLTVACTTPETVLARYAELMALKAAKNRPTQDHDDDEDDDNN